MTDKQQITILRKALKPPPVTASSIYAEFSEYKTEIHSRGIGGKDRDNWLIGKLVESRLERIAYEDDAIEKYLALEAHHQVARKALVDVVQKLGEMPGWRKAICAEFEGCITEIGANKTLMSNDSFNEGWNAGSDNAIRFIRSYVHGKGLFQIGNDSTSTLAETLQAICASALGDAEIGGDE